MKTVICTLFLTLCVAATPALADSWEEDLDGDGRKETKFFDDDGDGTPDNASVDRDGDGHYEEYWVDEDDDGDWDRMWFDDDGDDQFERGRFDRDDDGDWDQEWSDDNDNDEVDPGERVELEEEDQEPVDGPEPVIAAAARTECDCAGPRAEPEVVNASIGSRPIAWIVAAAVVLGLLYLVVRRRSRKGRI